MTSAAGEPTQTGRVQNWYKSNTESNDFKRESTACEKQEGRRTMATSGWLQEMRRAAEAAHRTTPTAAISRRGDARDVVTAYTTPAQAVQAGTVEMGNQPVKTAQGASQSATRRPQREFTAPTDATRDYRAMYAALFRFHERHSPPTPGDDDGALYWSATTDDMTATAQRFDNDPFMVNLLCVVFGELESEYKAMRQQATGA